MSKAQVRGHSARAIARFAATTSLCITAALVIGTSGLPRSASAGEIPTFTVDASWPKPLPNSWIIERPKGWRGKKAKSSLELGQAFSLLDAAEAIDAEFGVLCYTCLYTGRRIGELLNDETRLCNLNLRRGTLYLRDTKNGEAVTVHLPPRF